MRLLAERKQTHKKQKSQHIELSVRIHSRNYPERELRFF